MPYKVCASCKHPSYSACVSGIWLCPYCGKELTMCRAVHNRRRIAEGLAAEQISPQTQGKLHLLPHK